MGVLLVLIDGVGLGADDPVRNPLAAAELPVLRSLLGGRSATLAHSPYFEAGVGFTGLDTTLGVVGLPQSGTGHTALLTGVNAAQRFGRHFGPWVPVALRPLVARRSLLALSVAAGLRVAFANAYPEELLDGACRSGRQPLPLRIGPPLAALAAGLLTRHTAALCASDAVASDITNELWRERLGRQQLPRITAEQAGRNLARIAAEHDLTFFGHYATDQAGHRGEAAAANAAMRRVDAFLDGIVGGLSPETVLLLASDHGNIEELDAGHTRNPALGLAVGPGAGELAGRLRSITDVAPAIMATLGVAMPPAEELDLTLGEDHRGSGQREDAVAGGDAE